MGAIPPSTTLFFELHEEGRGKHVVRTFVWRPCGENADPAGWPGNQGDDCHAEKVELGSCGHECALVDFLGLIDARTAQTGDWASLCEVSQGASSLYETHSTAKHTDQTKTSIVRKARLLCALMSLMLLPVILCLGQQIWYGKATERRPLLGSFTE